MFQIIIHRIEKITQFKYFWILFVTLLSFPGILLSIKYSQGFNWPDEIFQSMELAHYIVTGRGNITWEFLEKARTSLYPQFLSLWLRIVYLFSSDPITVYISTRIMLAIFYLGGILSLANYFLIKNTSNSNSSLSLKYLLFLIVFILFPLNYYFGYRTLAESISTALTLISVFNIQSRIEEKNENILMFSILLGITYGIRFQMALFLCIYAPLLIYQLYSLKLHKAIFNLILGLLIGFIIYLISDTIFFGIPFISSINYFKVTILDGVGDQWGTSPFSFYFKQYYRYFNALLIFLIPGIYFNYKKHYPLIFGTIMFILIHSIISHKELRFIYFTFPILLFFILSGIWNIYIYFKKYNPKVSYSFLLFTLLGSFYLYGIVLNKKIQWNFLDDNLQLFLQAEKNGVNGNSLVTIQDTFAWGAGYVYLGQKFTGELFFYDMDKRSNLEKAKLISENQIKNILIKNTNRELYCHSFNFCSPLLTIGEYSWIKLKD